MPITFNAGNKEENAKRQGDTASSCTALWLAVLRRPNAALIARVNRTYRTHSDAPLRRYLCVRSDTAIISGYVLMTLSAIAPG